MTVVTFGTFDPLHEGHRHFFAQAARLGNPVLVVVASDDSIRAEKNREPYQQQDQRLATVQACVGVSRAILGNPPPHQYQLLRELDFDIVALGYDQLPSDDEARALLARVGKPHVQVVRLKPHQPEKYKSSYFR